MNEHNLYQGGFIIQATGISRWFKPAAYFNFLY